MNQPQQNRLSMNKAVSTLNRVNSEVWGSMHAFARAQTDLERSIAARDRAAEIQSAATTGVTKNKEQYTEQAVDAVMMVARNVAAYAVAQQDHALQAHLSYSKSYLMGLPDNERVGTLTEMMNHLSIPLEEREDYGLTGAVIMNADKQLKLLREQLTSPRDMLDVQSSATISIQQEEVVSRRVLNIMDRLIHNFAATYPDYVRQYRYARIIVDSGRRHEDAPAEDDGTKVD